MSREDPIEPKPDVVSLADEKEVKQVSIDAAHHSLWQRKKLDSQARTK